MDIFRNLEARLKEYGAECRIISASHIPELKSEYNKSISGQQIDKQFVKGNIQNYIDFSASDRYPTIQSIIIIASPSPEIEVKFELNEKIYSLKIPPHYSDRLKVTGNIRRITSQLFEENGYQTFSIVFPKKLLAVRSGLARYGKNNISYVSGMGSYHRLTAFASDLPCIHDSWQKQQILDRCSNCKACLHNCPTGAISGDRFLIKAERCLTFFNERSGPFPNWINPESHNSIVGCMRCQNICPENKKYKSVLVKENIFSERETSLILKGSPIEELPEILQIKISDTGIERYYKQLSRNIKVLIENEG